MKLELHLIPKSCFYENLRLALGPRWEGVSDKFKASKNYTCEICGYHGNKNLIHAHEHWEWDDEKHTQTLTKVECVCNICHAVMHWGQSHTRGCNMDELCTHAAKINGCTKKEFMNHVEESFATWRIRADQKWIVDFGAFKSYLRG